MRVWFNHWFSTAYYFIQSLQRSGFYVIASNKRDTCVYKTNANEFYFEPDIDGEDYINYCIDFCKEHKVDIFVPRKEMKYIIQQLGKFDELGVKVLCESNEEIFDIFESKSKTASYFKQLNIVSVPETICVNTAWDFLSAYKTIREHYGDVCLKYDCDEGGQSYKRIVNIEPSMSRISENNGLAYSLEHILKCMLTVDSFRDIVVMPYLNGTEVSVDCLGLGSDFIAVPRYKCSNRVTRLEQNISIYNICKKLWESAGLRVPFNVQFRYHNGDLYILEVNTRLSGGSWKAKYVGIDFIDLAVKQIAGVGYKVPNVHFDTKDLSNLEGVVEL